MVPFGTTYLLIEYQKKQVRRELKSKLLLGIDKQELILLKFKTSESKNLLEWEKSDEFCYKNEFYDVVEERIVGDSQFFWCWWDNDETQLNRRLSALLDLNFNSNPTKQDNQNRLSQFLETYYTVRDCSKIIHQFFLLQNSHIGFYQDFYQSTELNPPIPPPKIV